MVKPGYKPIISSLDPNGPLRRAHDLLERKRRDPDSVRFSLEQCQALVERAERMADDFHSCPVSPAVLRLLHSPTTILADRSLWPNADDIARSAIGATASYRHWIIDRANEAGGAWEDALQQQRVLAATATPEAEALRWLLTHATMPFPVGRDCDEVAPCLLASPAQRLMPFSGDVHAALIVSDRVGDTDLTLFFLADFVPFEIGMAGERIETGTTLVATGEMRRIVRGDPDDEDVQAFTSSAREWWGELARKPLSRSRGRPKGDGMWTPDAVWGRAVDFVNSTDPRTRRQDKPPLLGDFLPHIGMNPKTWNTFKKQRGWTWETLRDAATLPK